MIIFSNKIMFANAQYLFVCVLVENDEAQQKPGFII